VETYPTFAIIRAANIEYKKELKKKKYPQSEETEGKLQGKLFKLEKLLFSSEILIKLKNCILTEIPQLGLHFQKVLIVWQH
jgi:hypothetical protein